MRASKLQIPNSCDSQKKKTAIFSVEISSKGNPVFGHPIWAILPPDFDEVKTAKIFVTRTARLY